MDKRKLLKAILEIVIVAERIPHADPMTIEGLQHMGAVGLIPCQQDASIGALLFSTTSRLIRESRVLIGAQEARQVTRIRTQRQAHAKTGQAIGIQLCTWRQDQHITPGNGLRLAKQNPLSLSILDKGNAG